MSIISTVCSAGPMKSRECLALFGVEYQIYLLMIPFSLLIGFIASLIYVKIRKIKSNKKSFILKSLIISLIIFILASLSQIFLARYRIY